MKDWAVQVYTADEVIRIIDGAKKNGAKSVIITPETHDFISDGIRVSQVTVCKVEVTL